MKNRSATALRVVQRFFPKVKTVIDAKYPLDLEVTKSDVTQKGRKKHTECAIALACQRSLDIDGAIVSRSRAYLINGTTARRFGLSQIANQEVAHFDKTGEFLPGSYSLCAIKPSRRLGTRYKAKNTGKKNHNYPKNRQGHVHDDGVRASFLTRNFV